MIADIEDFEKAHNEKLKKLSKEEQAKAGLRKLAQELEVNKGQISEPEGLASGAIDADGKMIIDLGEETENDQ